MTIWCWPAMPSARPPTASRRRTWRRDGRTPGARSTGRSPSAGSGSAPAGREAGSVPVYALANAIDAGDVAGALETLHRLLTVTSPRQPKPLHALQVMGLLHNHYRRLARVDDPDVVDERSAVAALGGKVKAYPARKALEQARAIGSDGIREAFARLHQADLDLKGARAIPEGVVMEVLVARLAGLSARSGRRPSQGRRGGPPRRARR